MSSFDYTDNFSGFNDLINRSEFLTEAKVSPYAKYHPSFSGITKDLKTAGFSSAPLDTINFIRTALYNLELISDDELAAAKKGAGFRAKKDNLIALLDDKVDVIEQNKDEIAKEIEDGLAQYINRATTNRGKEEKYAAQKAALELAKDIKAGEDVGDAVEDAVGQMDAAESELAQSLQMSKEDPTTFIEIKIRDAERVEDVGNIVSKYANEDGLDISGDTVQFSVDPDTPLAKAVAAHGIDKIEAALKRDVDKISDSVVVVMAPDEDYEEDMYGMEGDDSYAANENEVQEDNEDEAAARDKPGGSNVGDYPNVSKDDFCGPAGGAPEGSYPVNSEKRARAALAYAHNAPDPEGIKNCVYRKAKKHGWFDRPDEDQENLDHFLTKEQPEDYIPSTDYEDVLNDLVNKDKKEHAMKKLTSEDEEEFNYSPMLESHKTDTSAYLTEQAASDKRNKKTEVKNQSFTEKYKPKTHWQLQELRRYGL
tara:strand:+ start:14 stop:1456 length:1443 start_codon:yes stop_codon:yes gene_type:complete